MTAMMAGKTLVGCGKSCPSIISATWHGSNQYVETFPFMPEYNWVVSHPDKPLLGNNLNTQVLGKDSEISKHSGRVKFASSTGIVPIHRPFARARGVCFQTCGTLITYMSDVFLLIHAARLKQQILPKVVCIVSNSGLLFGIKSRVKVLVFFSTVMHVQDAHTLVANDSLPVLRTKLDIN